MQWEAFSCKRRQMTSLQAMHQTPFYYNSNTQTWIQEVIHYRLLRFKSCSETPADLEGELKLMTSSSLHPACFFPFFQFSVPVQLSIHLFQTCSVSSLPFNSHPNRSVRSFDINPAPNTPISSRLAISQSVIRWL